MRGPSKAKHAAAREQQRKALPTCRSCRSYKATWDSRQPHACLFFGFRSYHLPAVEVYNSTGQACPQYRLKDRQPGSPAAKRNP